MKKEISNNQTSIKMKNLLHEFFNSQSDANKFLEATEQERMESDFLVWQLKNLNPNFFSVEQRNELRDQLIDVELLEKAKTLESARFELVDKFLATLFPFRLIPDEVNTASEMEEYLKAIKNS